MRRFSLFIISFIVFIIFIGCATTKVFVKNPDRLQRINRIAVLPFVCNNAEIGYNIAESLSANLVMSRFTIIERGQLQNLLVEQDLSLTGVIENNQLIIGKIKGVDAVIVGSATTKRGFAGMLYGGVIEYVSNCSARLIDIETGEVLLATNFTAESASTMSGVTTAAEIGESLARKISIY